MAITSIIESIQQSPPPPEESTDFSILSTSIVKDSRSVNITGAADTIWLIIGAANKDSQSSWAGTLVPSGWKRVFYQHKFDKDAYGNNVGSNLCIAAWYRRLTGSEGTTTFLAAGGDRYTFNIFKISGGGGLTSGGNQNGYSRSGGISALTVPTGSKSAPVIAFANWASPVGSGFGTTTFTATTTASEQSNDGTWRLRTYCHVYNGATSNVNFSYTSNPGSPCIMSGFWLKG